MISQATSNFEIVAREDILDVTYMLECHHPLMARAAQPGQFVIVMLHEHGERIPLTIADFDRWQRARSRWSFRRLGRQLGRCSRHATSAPRFTRLPALWAFRAT